MLLSRLARASDKLRSAPRVVCEEREDESRSAVETGMGMWCAYRNIERIDKGGRGEEMARSGVQIAETRGLQKIRAAAADAFCRQLQRGH